MPSVFNMVTKKSFKTGGRTAAFAALTLGFTMNLGLVSCSQRDPKIDTSKPTPANALGKPPGGNPPPGSSPPPGVPIPTALPGGRIVTPQPSVPGRSNIIIPTPMPSAQPGGRNIIPQPSVPGRSNIITPTPMPSGPGGNKPPIVNPSVPERSATQVTVPMQVDMSSGGPKVKIGLPTDATAVNLQYLGVTGIVEGTTVDISLSFSSGGKSCSIEKASARAEQQTVNVPCK